METHLSSFDGIVTTPLLLHFALIPSHLQLAARMAGSTWRANSLTGGDFENLPQLNAAGWINRREDSRMVTTTVELSRQAAMDGVYGLRLSAAAGNMSAQPAQAVPVWIRSAEVAVKEGQLVRIHGFVNVPAAVDHSHDGLLITDSLGGKDLASRVGATDGWQEFTIYRSVPRADRISVTFALTGYGSAMIDEVTIRILDSKSSESRASVGSRDVR